MKRLLCRFEDELVIDTPEDIPFFDTLALFDVRSYLREICIDRMQTVSVLDDHDIVKHRRFVGIDDLSVEDIFDLGVFTLGLH